MERIDFLKEEGEMCKTAIECGEKRIKWAKERLSVINEMIIEIEGRMDNTDSAQ